VADFQRETKQSMDNVESSKSIEKKKDITENQNFPRSIINDAEDQ